MQSFLDPDGNGIFNPALRFSFTNVTDKEFVSYWDGRPIKVQPGQSVELPQHLAVKMTKEMVDGIMMGEFKAEEVAMGTPLARSPRGSSLGVPAARKPYEDQILRQLEVDEESPEMAVLRAEIKSELVRDMEAKVSKEPVHAPSSITEFSELQEGGKVEQAPEKKPLKVKAIK